MTVVAVCPSCSSRMRVGEDLLGAGRKVKCPKCAEPVSIDDCVQNGNDDSTPRARVNSRKSVQPAVEDVEEVEEVEEASPPRKKGNRAGDEPRDPPRRSRKNRARQGGNGLLFALLGGGALLLIGLAVTIVLVTKRGDPGSPLFQNSSSPNDSLIRIPFTGKITFNGAPLTFGSVYFEAVPGGGSNYYGTLNTGINPDGTYSPQEIGKPPGLPAGVYKVSVGVGEVLDKGVIKPRVPINKSNNDIRTTVLRITVVPGAPPGAYDLHLMP